MKKRFVLFFCFFSIFVLSACSSGPRFEVPEGKVLLEEFSDLQCPACKGAGPLVEKLREEFPEDLVVRFVHFPLEQLHSDAFHAAEAAECVRDQGEEHFWQFVGKAYENQSSLNDETFKKIAEEIGLDMASFETCLTSGDKSVFVRADMKEGLKRRVNATPTFFLEGEKVEDRRYEVLVKKIQGYIEAKNPEQ